MKQRASIRAERLLAETYETAWIVALTREGCALLNQVTTRLLGPQFPWPFEPLVDGLPLGHFNVRIPLEEAARQGREISSGEIDERG